MTIAMDDTQITTLEQVREVLASSGAISFKGVGRQARYNWIDAVLKRFDYFSLGRKGKGLLKAYLQRLSGLSRAQLTRLVSRKLQVGAIRASYEGCHRIAAKYTSFDKELLAQTDNAHGRMSSPATKSILERQHEVYRDKRFERLAGISSAHIYNLRKSRVYQQRAQSIAKTRSVQVAIGIRRKPDPQGRPGYIRVDTVHQGDLDGRRGVYHINMVDAVTQWEIVACVETISEAHLEPVLEEALGAFPFVILNFHSDNGSEFINGVVAKLLNRLLIEQRHAPLINRFYREHFNVYLNFHRPCGFATVTVDAEGRRHKKYETYQTPHERLKSLANAGKHLRDGVSLEALDRVATRQADNECAAAMQEARDRLFRKLGAAEPTARPTAGALRRS